MKLAITGTIACGKSSFARRLRARGAETLDADDVAHELLLPASPTAERVRARFGTVERAALGAIVFSDAAARRALEAIVWPEVRSRLLAFAAESVPGRLRFAVVPLLYESGWDADYDRVCAVTCSPEASVARMMADRGHSRAEAMRRLAAQWPAAEKARLADYVVRNEGTEEDLEAAADAFMAWVAAENG